MAAQHFDNLLSDDEMLIHLSRREILFFKVPKWHAIERQIERLGFDRIFFVTEVDSIRGKFIKVTPAMEHGFLRRVA